MNADSVRLVEPDPAKRHGRRTAFGIAAALASTVVLLLVWYSIPENPHDPRAYPGSQSQSLEKMLQGYQLTLPACANATVRYLYYVQGATTDSFYLYFQAGRPCVDEFLRANGLAGAETYESLGLPFERAGDWPQDMSKGYTVSRTTLQTPGNPSLVSAEVALDLADADIDVYVQAVRL